MSHSIQPGVITGKQVQEVFQLAKDKKFALPAVNVIGSSSINGVLETAASLTHLLSFSFPMAEHNLMRAKGFQRKPTGSHSWSCGRRKTRAQLARSIRAVVILHTDHAAKKLLPWIDGLLDASEKHFAETGNHCLALI